MHEQDNSNQDSVIIGRYTKPKKGTFIQHPTQEINETTGYLLHKANKQRLGVIVDLIHINKDKETPKLGNKETSPK